MASMMYRGRSVTTHPRGLAATEVRIDGQFAVQWNFTPAMALYLVQMALDVIDTQSDKHRGMAPCWYLADDPRRAEAERSHGVPRREGDR